jgi:predicted transglutaminase-like cysteine proteinase
VRTPAQLSRHLLVVHVGIIDWHPQATGHAVVAVRYDQRWVILENRTMAILDAEDVRDYRPLFALDQHGTQTIATASIDLITNR